MSNISNIFLDIANAIRYQEGPSEYPNYYKPIDMANAILNLNNGMPFLNGDPFISGYSNNAQKKITGLVYYSNNAPVGEHMTSVTVPPISEALYVNYYRSFYTDEPYPVNREDFYSTYIISSSLYSPPQFSRYNNFNSTVIFEDRMGSLNMVEMFSHDENFNQPISINCLLEEQAAINLAYAFKNCFNFNSPVYLNSNLLWLLGTFENCYNFNQPFIFYPQKLQPDYSGIMNGNRSSRYDNTFSNCYKFNQPISYLFPKNEPDFKQNQKINANYFCANCYEFNQLLDFTYCYISNMENSFINCYNFNQPINFAHAVFYNLNNTFTNCINFNSPINFAYAGSDNGWSALTHSFDNCISFNSTINFSYAHIARIEQCFINCYDFNQPIDFYHFGRSSYGTDLYGVFINCYNLNSNINFINCTLGGISGLLSNCNNFNSTINFINSKTSTISSIVGSGEGNIITPSIYFENSSTSIDNMITQYCDTLNIKAINTDFTRMIIGGDIGYINNYNINLINCNSPLGIANLLTKEREIDIVNINISIYDSDIYAINTYRKDYYGNIVGYNNVNVTLNLNCYNSNINYLNNVMYFTHVDGNVNICNCTIYNAVNAFKYTTGNFNVNLSNTTIKLPQNMFIDSQANIETVNLYNFSAGANTAVFGMFMNCQNLGQNSEITLNLSKMTALGVGNTVNTGYIFARCNNLNQPIDLSYASLNATGMFLYCNSLNQPINLYRFIGHNGKFSFNNMFRGCSKLNQLIDFSNVVSTEGGDFSYTFDGCTDLNQPILFPSSDDPQYGIEFSGTFLWCNTLNRSFDFSHIAGPCNFNYTFASCRNFSNQNIYLPPNTKNIEQMFAGCYNLQSLNLFVSGIIPNTVNNVFLCCGWNEENSGYNRQEYINVYCPNLASSAIFRNYQRRLFGTSQGQGLSWTSITNGYTNARYKINIYHNYVPN